MEFTYRFPRPAVTVDCIIFRIYPDEITEVLLIKRANEPFKNKWALPGGFINIDEEIEHAAKRELFEETGIIHHTLEQLFTIGTVGRDPRHRTISIIYGGLFNSATMKINAGDDAKEAAWFRIDNLPPLAFDHNNIIRKTFSGYIKNNI